MASPFATADPLAQNAFNFDLKKAIETAKMDDDGDDDDDEVGEPIDFADALEEAIVELGYDADSDARAELAQKLKAAIDGTAPFPEELRAKVAEKTGADAAAVDAAMERRARPVLAAVTAAIAYEKERESELEELDDEERDEEEDKDAKILDRLRQQGPCPAGFAWFRQGNGWRCGGGSTLCTTTTRCSRGSEGVNAVGLNVKLMCANLAPELVRIHTYANARVAHADSVWSDLRQRAIADSERTRAMISATPDACLPTSVTTPSFHITGMGVGPHDANAIFPYKGVWHAMHQANWTDWAHLTSPDLVHWTRTPSLAPNGDWDGTLSMLDGKLIIFFDCYSVEDCDGSYVPPARRQRQRRSACRSTRRSSASRARRIPTTPRCSRGRRTRATRSRCTKPTARR